MWGGFGNRGNSRGSFFLFTEATFFLCFSYFVTLVTVGRTGTPKTRTFCETERGKILLAIDFCFETDFEHSILDLFSLMKKYKRSRFELKCCKTQKHKLIHTQRTYWECPTQISIQAKRHFSQTLSHTQIHTYFNGPDVPG